MNYTLNFKAPPGTGLISWGLLSLLAIGCGSSDLGKVTGKVTLDGQPLSDAILLFSPTSGGPPSSAKTDSDGRFQVIHTREERGAVPGEHEVWISTALPADTDGETPRPAIAERVPPSYRVPGGLKAEVKPGSNTINFELSSAQTVLLR